MITFFTRFEFHCSNKPYLSTKIIKIVSKIQQKLYYFPIQKSLKILPNISSTSTFPTIMPRCLVANLKSSAALSKSSTSFFLLKLLRCSKHCSRCCLCRSLVIKISSLVINLFFKLFFIFEISSSIFKFSLIEINTWLNFFISGSISPFKRSDSVSYTHLTLPTTTPV